MNPLVWIFALVLVAAGFLAYKRLIKQRKNQIKKDPEECAKETTPVEKDRIKPEPRKPSQAEARCPPAARIFFGKVKASTSFKLNPINFVKVCGISHATHFVTDSYDQNNSNPTSLIQALDAGKFIVNSSWVGKCLKERQRVDERAFIPNGCTQAKQVVESKVLFKGIKFRGTPSVVRDVEILVKAAGGEMVKSDNERSDFIISNEDYALEGMKIHSLQLLFTAIELNRLEPKEDDEIPFEPVFCVVCGEGSNERLLGTFTHVQSRNEISRGIVHLSTCPCDMQQSSVAPAFKVVHESCGRERGHAQHFLPLWISKGSDKRRSKQYAEAVASYWHSVPVPRPTRSMLEDCVLDITLTLFRYADHREADIGKFKSTERKNNLRLLLSKVDMAIYLQGNFQSLSDEDYSKNLKASLSSYIACGRESGSENTGEQKEGKVEVPQNGSKKRRSKLKKTGKLKLRTSPKRGEIETGSGEEKPARKLAPRPRRGNLEHVLAYTLLLKPYTSWKADKWAFLTAADIHAEKLSMDFPSRGELLKSVVIYIGIVDQLHKHFSDRSGVSVEDDNFCDQLLNWLDKAQKKRGELVGSLYKHFSGYARKRARPTDLTKQLSQAFAKRARQVEWEMKSASKAANGQVKETEPESKQADDGQLQVNSEEADGGSDGQDTGQDTKKTAAGLEEADHDPAVRTESENIFDEYNWDTKKHIYDIRGQIKQTVNPYVRTALNNYAADDKPSRPDKVVFVTGGARSINNTVMEYLSRKLPDPPTTSWRSRRRLPGGSPSKVTCFPPEKLSLLREELTPGKQYWGPFHPGTTTDSSPSAA